MRARIFIPVIFILFLDQLAGAQQTSGDRPVRIDKSGEFNLCLFAGFSFLGPHNDMETNMSASDLGQISPAGWFGDAKAHPFTRKYPIAHIEATYYFSGKMGVSVNGGIANNIEVFGYQDIGIGNYMILKSEIWSVSINYTYRFRDNRNSFFIGPTYFIHHVKKDTGSENPPQNKNTKLGANIGYSLQIVQKKHWFMAVRATYMWAPKSEIGPFVAEHQLGLANPTPETYTSVFKPTKVSLACLNFGLCIGLKMTKGN